MFEVGLNYILKNDNTLTAMVPGGIFPSKLPQRPNYPALSYFRIGNSQPAQAFGKPPGGGGLDRGIVQISIFCRQDDGGGYVTTLDIDTRLRTLLDGVAPIVVAGVDIRFLQYLRSQDLYEDQDRIFHRVVEYQFTVRS